MRKKLLIPPAVAATLACLLVPARADFSSSVLALHPVAYWPLTETTAPPSQAFPAANNLGTLGSGFNANFGGDTVFGYPGALKSTTDSADSFNGFNSRAPATYSPDVSSAPSFTVEAWLLAHDDGTYWGTTCALSDVEANSPRAGWLIYMDVANLGQYTFRAYATNGTASALSMNLGAPGSIQLEKWYHIAIVVSNAVTVTNVYGYVNGTLVAGPVPLPAYVPNTGAHGGFTIGDRSDNTGFTYTGGIDEVAYYTNALDGATILAHYQAGTNPSPGTAYSTLVQQSQPELYYRLDEGVTAQGPYPVALPVAANLGSLGAAANGYYQPGTTPGVAGPTNAGFGPSSVACGFPPFQSTDTAGPAVMCAPFNQTALNLSDAITLTSWIQVPAGGVGWFQTIIGRGDVSYRFDVDGGGLPHWAANPNSDVIGSVPINDGAWHFWAGVFDPVSDNFSLYIDGLLSAQAVGSPLANLTCYLLLGGAPDYLGRNFPGAICHTAIFTNALTSAQIRTLYESVGVAPNVLFPTNQFYVNEDDNVAFPAIVSGTPTLNFQWYSIDLSSVTTAVTGQTTDTLSLSNVPAALNLNQYYLVVTNTYGSVTSSIVTLNVFSGAPTIAVDVKPLSQQVPTGVSVTYSVLVNGTVPFSYQWFKDGAPIDQATNSSVTFPAPAGSNYYSCTITNNAGQAKSAVVGLIGSSSPPPLLTFAGDGTGWTINTNATMKTASIASDVLTLTDGTNGEVTTAFFNTPQYDGGFVAFFTYQEADGSAPLADGATFCIQNSSAGATAIGGGGGELGFTGIGNSFAFEMNVYNGAHGGVGIQFGTNGMTADSPIATLPYFSTAPVNLAGTHPINVRLYFTQGVAYLRLVDATTGDTYMTTHNLGDIRSAIGADVAYVGFTGATGGLNAIQKISGFRFSYTTSPVLSVASSGANALITWPVSVSTMFVLQSSPSPAGPWSNWSGTPPTIVGLQNQLSVPTAGAPQFFRLELQ